jgi:peptidase E
MTGGNVRGRLVFNGNMGSPHTFMQRVRPWLLGARPDRQPPVVLLVSAAWGAGEYGEGPVREALNQAGVPSDWHAGFDRQIENLCVWHLQHEYLAQRPGVAAVARELAAVQDATRRFYVDKTAFHAQRIREAVAYAKSKVGRDFRIGALPLQPRDDVRPEATLDGPRLLAHALTRELTHDLADLVQNDVRMLRSLDEAEEALAVRTGLRLDPLWQRMQATLNARILRADALFLPGGDPDVLLTALRFFDLKPALHETLRRGATFFSISAGTLVLGERMVIYDNYSADPARREFRLYDRGLGLIGGLQILPHCMDRIHTDDPDNLAYLARRFSSHVCVGLNEESFLLVEPATPAATSIGTQDGVYVFGPDGVKQRFDAGQAIPLGA